MYSKDYIFDIGWSNGGAGCKILNEGRFCYGISSSLIFMHTKEDANSNSGYADHEIGNKSAMEDVEISSTVGTSSFFSSEKEICDLTEDETTCKVIGMS